MKQWLAALALLSGCSTAAPERMCKPPARLAAEPGTEAGMRWIPPGRYLIGARPERPEEGPPHPVDLQGFWIDQTEVTNADFAAFVAATGYRTLAERAPDPALYPGIARDSLVPSSLVFVPLKSGERPTGPASWWKIIPGADWRHPQGPDSDITGHAHEPVVHIGHADALAYARWRGRDLPSEAEWEAAARGGLVAAQYSWGDQRPGGDGSGPARANVWQGPFPVADTGGDGYKAKVAPVACFAPNGFGLYDMAGNVWEWTSGTMGGGGHVIKGGSYLCADNYCYRYRPAAREEGPPDTGASHIGFRTVRRGSALPE